MSKWCAKESTEVPLALTCGQTWPHPPGSGSEGDPASAGLTNIHHSCPALLPMTSSSPVDAASISCFICSEHFKELFAPFLGPKSSKSTPTSPSSRIPQQR